MDNGIPDREALIEYFLGELSEEERFEIAGRYFADDDLFDELLDVENELLEKYARGSLNEKQHEVFKLYLARLPGGRQKEATARALLQFTAEDNERAQKVLSKHARTRVSLWAPLWKPLSKSQALLRYTAVAGLLAVAIVLLLLFSQLMTLRTHNDNLRAEIADLEKEKESLEHDAQNSQSGSDRVRHLEEQLKLEQLANEAQAQRLATLQPTTPVVVAWTLTPALRSATGPDKVTLPRSATFVSVTMPIDSEERIQNYGALIQTTTGEDIREQPGLRANKTRKSVTVRLPAEYFKATSYKVTLAGKDKDAVELARDYYFTVAKQ